MFKHREMATVIQHLHTLIREAFAGNLRMRHRYDFVLLSPNHQNRIGGIQAIPLMR